MSLPTEATVDAALQYLASTDAEYGRLVGHVRGLEHRLKVVKATVFLDAAGTVAEREAQAYASEEYGAGLTEFEDASIELETIRARRKRAELTIEVWRSLNSAAKRGNII